MTRILRSAARAPVSEETFHVHLNLNVTIAEPAVAAEPAVVAEPAAVAEPSSPQTLPRTRSAARLARTLVSSPSQAQLARDLQTSVATILPSTVINLSPIKESTVIEEDRASGEITDCDPSSEMSDRADSDDGAPTETSEEEQQLTMQSDSAEQVGDFVKDDASNNIADASDNNADVSNENADVSDKNADASDENTDTSDENTDVSDNNADASDENADASDKMSDSEQDDDNSAEEEGSDTSEGSEADNQAGVGDEDETSIPETLYFHEDISVFSFGEEDDICRQIACEILPIERTAVLEAFLDEKGKVRARLVADTSAEDRAKFNDLWNLINASKAAHNIFGSAACQVIRFRFIKTTALAGILTGSRAWDLNDGLPTLLCRIKSFQIHKSFTQPFKDWCADLALLEIGPDGVMELDGLRNLIFTGMPAGRDAEASGTIYMPSALEKLRALFGKLKSRVWDTWIVSKDVDEDKNVTVRLISKDDLDHVSFGVKDDVSSTLPAFRMSTDIFSRSVFSAPTKR